MPAAYGPTESGHTDRINYWLADGYVHLHDGLGDVVSIPYVEWNEIIDRIGHRYPEADRTTPP